MSTTIHRLTAGRALILIGLSLILVVNLTAPRAVRANPGVFYAAPTVQGSGDCSSWTHACTLQTALAAAVSGDEIWVKAGVHKPTSDPGNRSAFFALKNGVAVYGGFAGGETSLEQRDWQVNATILSGDIDDDDINADGNFIAETTGDIQGNNSYQIVYSGGVNAITRLDGFVITAGDGVGRNAGAGMMVSDSSNLTLINLIIIGNKSNTGSGMYIGASSPALINIQFINNYSTYRGGGLRISSSDGTTITNSLFLGNHSEDHGGAIEINYSGIFGVGVTFTNVAFWGNSSATVAAGIFSDNSRLILNNLTFSGNSTPIDPAGIYSYQSIWTINNVIMWGDQSATNAEFIRDTSYYSPVTIQHSNIHGCGPSGATWNTDNCGTDGSGNIDSDPLFLDTSGGNLRLQLTSPAIDAGNNASVPASITTDIDGKARFVDIASVSDTGSGTAPIVDMGAYERYEDSTAPTVLSITRLDPNPTNSDSVHYKVIFSEAVIGVQAGDFSLTATGLTGASVTGVTGSGATYTVTVNTGSGSGTSRLDIPATATISDLIGNPLSGLPYTGGEEYEVSKVRWIFLPLVVKN